MWERIYAIYDKTAEQIVKGQVAFVMLYGNDAVARRDFTQIVAEKNSPMSKYPDEYALIHLGRMDVESGTVEGNADGPRQVCTARECIGKDPAQLDLTDEQLAARQPGRTPMGVERTTTNPPAIQLPADSPPSAKTRFDEMIAASLVHPGHKDVP